MEFVISGTRLDQQTNHSMNQTCIQDNIQLYLYPTKYSLRDIQKVTNYTHLYHKGSGYVIPSGARKIFERRQCWPLWISTKRCILGPQTTAILITETRARGCRNAHTQFVKKKIIPVWCKAQLSNPGKRKFNWCGLKSSYNLYFSSCVCNYTQYSLLERYCDACLDP